ncbi:MAG: hypothetical protein PHI28_19385, partial [Mangrovibacterium sp.]|nr:hypothetical protein [Mangrovibacterium sp.]
MPHLFLYEGFKTAAKIVNKFVLPALVSEGFLRAGRQRSLEGCGSPIDVAFRRFSRGFSEWSFSGSRSHAGSGNA